MSTDRTTARPLSTAAPSCGSSPRTERWHPHYCEPAFREWAGCHNSAERAAAEAAYLGRIVHKAPHACRILDLGCGLGERATALAKAGFAVIGIDACQSAIDAARSRAAELGVEVEWHVLDPTALDPWPAGNIDVAVCMQGLGWGSKALQLRTLRRVRASLSDSGILVVTRSPFWLDCSKPLAGQKQFGGSFEATYDPVTSCISGRMITTENRSPAASPYSFRFYSVGELGSLVRNAGFVIEQIDADLSPGGTATPTSKRIEIVARRLPSLVDSLAVSGWGMQSSAELDLRYAPDEAELLDPSPSELWQGLIQSSSQLGSEMVGNYPVDDPYGAQRGAEIVGRYFNCSIAPEQVTFAAGVTAFLRCLSELADGGRIAAAESVHGDLEAWALNCGAEVQLVGDDDDATLRAALESQQVSLLHLDRPTFSGRFLEPDALQELVALASRSGTIVLIDESAAPYPGPSASAARLTPRADNLVVLRGFTKAYSWGGLRAGFAVTSPALAWRVRELVPPLQIGELALHAALRLLRAGDVFGRLRARIYAVKPTVARLLAECGLKVIEGHPSFPWLAVANDEASAERLFSERRIRCLRPTLSPTLAPPPKIVRVTIPLSDNRIALLHRLLTGHLAAVSTDDLPSQTSARTTLANEVLYE